MLRSKYCQLEDQTEHDLTTLGECPPGSGKDLLTVPTLLLSGFSASASLHS